MQTHTWRPRQTAAVLSLLFGFLAICGAAWSQAPTNVVISQIYTAGGNSGATYNADFIELFNPTGATLTLNNYSIQYASATGTTISTVTTLPASITLAPGRHYLIASTAGTNGAALPVTADYTDASIAFGAAAGKVALVSSATRLSGACALTDATVVDYIGYGTTASCSFGSPAPAPGTTQADIRSNACVATGNSSTEYTLGAPNPRNLTSTAATCSGGAALSGAGAANPATLSVGSSTLLTVAVTPATGGVSSSTGITVTANLTALGGSATTAFHDDGLNGDATAGDNVFSYSASVPGSTAAGAVSITATVRDAQLRSATASIPLTLIAPAPVVTIAAIQASKPSPLVDQTIRTSGIVVGVRSGGFWIESKTLDPNATVAQGVYVYAGSTTLPSYVAIGNEVEVTAKVSMYSYNPSLTQAVELINPSFSLLSSNNTLPTPITITAAMDSPSGGINQFTKYEGMRVAIGSLTTTSGTDASLNEVTETNTSNGFFYGVVTGVARAFREPGISVLEPTLPAGTPSGVPRWDANPEVIEIDSKSTGGSSIEVTTGMVLTGISGVMDFTEGTPTVVLDLATRPTVSGTPLTATAVPAAAANEVTVASFNMERFYNDQSDSAGTSATSAVVVTTAAYQRRLAKGSLAIRNVLRTPDILGLQEIENIAVLNDLSAKISADSVAAGQADPLYAPCLIQGNDIGGINVGFLVKSTRVTTVRCEQFGKADTFTNSTGSAAVLNDRPPLVLHAIVKGSGTTTFPLTVISNHLRSLINVDDTTATGATVRLKREAEAEYLAKLIQGYQAAGEHVVSVGDYNAFEFSDGYADVMGVVRGNPVPATQVSQAPASGLVNPNLVDLVTLLPATERRSYVESGNAQVLDHVVVTPEMVNSGYRLVYAHMDADFPLTLLNDSTRPERVSDHDPPVAYFTFAPGISATTTTVAFGTQALNTTGSKFLSLTNTGNATLNFASFTLAGAGFSSYASNCGPALGAGVSCNVEVRFTPTTTGTSNGTLTIVTNAATSPTVITLTGSGGDFTLTPAVTTTTVASGSTALVQIAVASVGSFAGTVNFTCTGLTTGEACAITPASQAITAGATSVVSLTVSTTARMNAQARSSQRASAERPASRTGTMLSLSGVSLAALLGCFRLRRARIGWRALAICCLAGALGSLAGCSNGVTVNPNGTPAGTQTVTVTATSGTLTHSISVSLTVQ